MWGMKRLIVTFCVLLAALAQVRAQETQEKHLDIIFLIDASGSMRITDPHDFRKVAVKAFVDITQDRGGDRIAILQFAGWNETSKKGAVLFPLMEIPSQEGKRDKLLSLVRETVESKVGAFGKGTDFNFAFEKALGEILAKRKEAKSDNDAWVILLTDGTTDVKEGGDTRKEYVEAAGGDSRAALNKAAQKHFGEKVLPGLAARKDLHITCISFADGEPSPELKLLEQKAGAKVIRTKPEALRGVFVEALASLPRGVYRDDLTRGLGYSRKELAAGERDVTNFRIYQGTSVMRALVCADNKEFVLEIGATSRELLPDPKSVKFTGAGEAYRVISMTNPKRGQYRLYLRNESKEKMAFETLFIAQFGCRAAVSLESADKLEPGKDVRAIVSLGDKGNFISDPHFLKDLQAVVKLKLPGGKELEQSLKFATAPFSKAEVKFTVPEDAPGGEAVVEAAFRALKQTISGEYAFASAPAKASFRILGEEPVIAEKPPEPKPEPKPVEPEPEPKPVEPEPEPVKPEPVKPEPAPVQPEPEPEPKPVEPVPPPVVEPEPEPEPKPVEPAPPPVVEPEPEPQPPEPEPEPVPEIEPEQPEKPTKQVEELVAAETERKGGFPLWALGVVAAGVVAVVLLVLLIMSGRKSAGPPAPPAIDFGDRQLWSATGDARLLADFGEGSEVTGTPEIPNAIAFRMTGSPEAPVCQIKPGPEGKIYVNGVPVSDWADLPHGAKIEVEAAGRPEVPVFKYTYFQRDPTAAETKTVVPVQRKPEKRRASTVKPEDIFPTDVLEKERLKGGNLPAPSDDDELMIYDEE